MQPSSFTCVARGATTAARGGAVAPSSAAAYGSAVPETAMRYHDVGLSSASGEPRNVAAAILFREILKPLANGLGPVGEIALGAVADELFLRNRR